MAFQLIFHACDADLQQVCRSIVDEWKSTKSIFELKTSGSTGTPKIVHRSRKQIEASAKRTNAFFGLHASSEVLLCINPAHIGGKMVLIRALVGNYTVHVVTTSRRFWEQIPALPFDFVSLVPLQIDAALSENPDVFRLFRAVLLGGSALNSETEKVLATNYSDTTAFYLGYGMTETISHIALRKIGKPDYQPLSGVEIHAFSDHTRIEDHETGVIDVICSDLLELRENGNFQWIGRADFVINSGGLKFHPEQIEQALDGLLEGIYIMSSIPDDTLGEQLVLVTEKEQTDRTKSLVNARISELFGKYAVPKQWIVHSIPSNGSKFMRKQLQDEIRGKHDA